MPTTQPNKIAINRRAASRDSSTEEHRVENRSGDEKCQTEEQDDKFKQENQHTGHQRPMGSSGLAGAPMMCAAAAGRSAMRARFTRTSVRTPSGSVNTYLSVARTLRSAETVHWLVPTASTMSRPFRHRPRAIAIEPWSEPAHRP